jgi:hypothetical protein
MLIRCNNEGITITQMQGMCCNTRMSMSACTNQHVSMSVFQDNTRAWYSKQTCFMMQNNIPQHTCAYASPESKMCIK